MARKSPPTVEPNEIGCVWTFSGMFDHHHHRHHRSRRKLLTDESHTSKSLPGPARNQVQMLTFDEQLRSINNESMKKTASADQSNKKRENDTEKSLWKKITPRYENPNKKKENNKIVDTIVVLKPSKRVVESAVDVGCRCSYLHERYSSTSKQQIGKRANTNVSFNDVRRKLKNSKKLNSIQKMKSCGEVNGNGSKILKQEPEVFVEARRHLAERLRLMAQGAGLGESLGSSSKRVSRTLERVLLSSPKHESMASFGREPEGAHGARSLQKSLSGSSRQNLDSDPQNIVSIEGSQLEFTLDVPSPKADCKSENTDIDRFRENPSPVSVLDSFFSDNICSPTSTIESVELQIQPHRLDFEEHSSQTSSPPRNTSLSLISEDRMFISSYVNDIYQFSQSNWEDFLATKSSCDHNKLLHDCVKEVLVSLHSRMTLISSKIRPFSLEKDAVNEVIEQVDWHSGQPAGPRTLDHLVKRDIVKCGQWIDTLSDENDIVFEVVDETLQELIMEAVLTFGLTG